jgi:hypothetical protein
MTSSDGPCHRLLDHSRGAASRNEQRRHPQSPLSHRLSESPPLPYRSMAARPAITSTSVSTSARIFLREQGEWRAVHRHGDPLDCDEEFVRADLATSVARSATPAPLEEWRHWFEGRSSGCPLARRVLRRL